VRKRGFSSMMTALLTFLPLFVVLLPPAAAQVGSDSLPAIAAHDNRVPGGTLAGGVLALRLETGTGTWRPEKGDGPGIVVHAFREAGGPLTVPGPLIRVPEDTELRIRIRNRNTGSPLIVHGLHVRPGAADDTLHVAPGGTREIRFRAGAPGTYFYWATTTGASTTETRTSVESQLGGAFLVDPREGPAADDRIFVIGLWPDPDRPGEEGRLPGPGAVVVNGLSWPHTERFRYALGDSIRWRWINLSDRAHPMHLHGSYFEVESRGDAERDTLYAREERPLAVTETNPAAGTFSMLWMPERAGNWLFHCHTLAHISPKLRREQVSPTGDREHAENHAILAMSGLAVGIEVVAATPVTFDPPANRRRVRLIAAREPGRYGTQPGYGFVLEDGERPRRPGPPLILTRGEPTGITIVNRLDTATSVHWHGMELESYYDGVSGWSGGPGRIAPSIAPGDSFEVYMTPPRAGTFIYHTHFDEELQLTSGLYGPLIVMEPGETLDPRTDRVLLLSADGPVRFPTTLLNGRQAPELELEAGTTYRLRLINIADNGVRVFSLLADERPVSWRAVAKDGAELPLSQRVERSAQQRIGVGETYDFEFTPDTPGVLRIDVRQRGQLVLAGFVRVTEPTR
jgi:FtsP/CotA-like multicopper oxidase with cupredoxin domain